LPCTARLISFALNSDALACTVILSLPPVALSTSADELDDVLRMEVGRRVRGRHIPFGLRRCTQRDRQADRGGEDLNPFMEISLRVGTVASESRAGTRARGVRARTRAFVSHRPVARNRLA
jgi:hypothetical protein